MYDTRFTHETRKTPRQQRLRALNFASRDKPSFIQESCKSNFREVVSNKKNSKCSGCERYLHFVHDISFIFYVMRHKADVIYVNSVEITLWCFQWPITSYTCNGSQGFFTFLYSTMHFLCCLFMHLFIFPCEMHLAEYLMPFCKISILRCRRLFYNQKKWFI